ncbi:MAG: ABC transporter substrate-binding protein [Chloroflexota bacterium]
MHGFYRRVPVWGWIALLLVITGAIVLFWPRATCQDELGCVTVEPGAPVRLAYLLVTSGDNADLGLDTRRGIEIAIDDRPLLRGHPITLIGEDSGCHAETAAAAAARLVTDETIVAVIGPSCSSEAAEAVPLLSQAGLTLVSPSTTRPLVTGLDRGYLRLANDYTRQSQAAAIFAYQELGLRQVATLYPNDLYADALQQAFADTFVNLGGTITTQATLYETGDLESALANVAQGRPDALYLPVSVTEDATLTGADLVLAVRASRELAGVALIGSETLANSDLLAVAGDAAEGFYVTQPQLIAGPAYESFLGKYQQKYGEAPRGLWHAHAYDAAQLIFAAMEKVAVMEADGTLHIGRQALRTALWGTRGVEGLTGRLHCDASGACGDATISLAQVQASQFQVVCVYARSCATPTPQPLAAATPTPPPGPTGLPVPTLAAGRPGLIAFASDRDGDWDIYLMNPDGSQPVNLTNNLADDQTPAWSPDGRRLAFASNRDGNWEIYTMTAQGTDVVNLTNHPAADRQPAWSFDGNHLAFVSDRDGNLEIYTMGDRGAGARNLTRHLASDENPTWSPEGTQLAFTSNRDGDWEIYTVTVTGEQPRQLTNNQVDDQSPAWLPDGTQIAFVSYRDGNAELYLVRPDGRGPHNLTQTAAWEWQPAWAPDGRHLVFASDRDGNWELYTMAADGTVPTRLTFLAAEEGAAVWGTNGGRQPIVAISTPSTFPSGLITFSSDRDGDWDIYAMNADGSNLTNLTRNIATDFYSVWSPDHQRLAFVSDRDGNAEIYVMNADGSSQTRLTDDPADDLFPAWSPDGEQIIFQSSRSGEDALYTVRVDGTDVQPLADQVASNWYLAWSPDKEKLAFMSDEDDDPEIYVTNSDGSDQDRLTENPANDDDPDWSLDGQRIVFHSNRNGNYEIYVMRADGFSPINLTRHPADDRFPSWASVSWEGPPRLVAAMAPTPRPTPTRARPATGGTGATGGAPAHEPWLGNLKLTVDLWSITPIGNGQCTLEFFLNAEGGYGVYSFYIDDSKESPEFKIVDRHRGDFTWRTNRPHLWGGAHSFIAWTGYSSGFGREARATSFSLWIDPQRVQCP